MLSYLLLPGSPSSAAITKGRFLLSGRSSVSAVGLYQLARISKRRCQSVLGSTVLGAYRLGVLSLYDAGMILRSHGAAGLVFLFHYLVVRGFTYNPHGRMVGADLSWMFWSHLLDFLRDVVFLILDTPLSRAVKHLRIRNRNLLTLHYCAVTMT